MEMTAQGYVCMNSLYIQEKLTEASKNAKRNKTNKIQLHIQ